MNIYIYIVIYEPIHQQGHSPVRLISGAESSSPPVTEVSSDLDNTGDRKQHAAQPAKALIYVYAASRI
jgi:hypothetical protein